jgi:hypothetical protein
MDKPHNMFISWSGERSGAAAEFLRKWLPKVIQAAKPWLSSKDIEKGSRSLDEIAKALQGVRFGIICLTPENLNAPWILYEAGALSKTIDDGSRLWTYLLGGLQPKDVTPPLGSFQATVAEEEDTRKLLHTINTAVSEEAVREENLNELFDLMWPKLRNALHNLPPPDRTAPAKRSTEDMVAELLEITRAEANRRRESEDYESIMDAISGLYPTTYVTSIGATPMVMPTPGAISEVARSTLGGKKILIAPGPKGLQGPTSPPEPFGPKEVVGPGPPPMSNADKKAK